ncbi:hypothetical protein EA472_10845 [Natrarchaeobius oligotrophus]|uniref:Uncharacterized protein n=1 Tax=Natrarchaeobius chitinivorans TaxID=1679083 RepID=A0A3N6MVI2_NATCH|nr:hypothetical protein EA472_10845 [Natrarchaeobius chitinivorans]
MVCPSFPTDGPMQSTAVAVATGPEGESCRRFVEKCETCRRRLTFSMADCRWNYIGHDVMV